MEFETRKSDYLTIKFNRKRTIPVTILLRALAAVDDGMPARHVADPDRQRRRNAGAVCATSITTPITSIIASTLKHGTGSGNCKTEQTVAEAALLEFYRTMRPGDPPTLDNAREYLESQLFDQRRYDLERVGRYKLNQRLRSGRHHPAPLRTITKVDIVEAGRAHDPDQQRSGTGQTTLTTWATAASRPSAN